MTLDSGGTITGGSTTTSDGDTTYLSKTQVTIDPDGAIAGSVSASGAVSQILQGSMTGTGYEVLWMSYNSDDGTYELTIAVRPPPEPPQETN